MGANGTAYIRMMDVPEDANPSEAYSQQISAEAKHMNIDNIPSFAGGDKGLIGVKFDEGKPRLDLIPSLALEEVAKVLMFGASKYDSWNWAKGMDWSRNPTASLRHTYKFLRGEDVDPETGICHMAHTATDALFATEYFLRGIGKDDRYKWGK